MEASVLHNGPAVAPVPAGDVSGGTAGGGNGRQPSPGVESVGERQRSPGGLLKEKADKVDKGVSKEPVSGTSPGRLSEVVAEANGALRQLDVHLELSVDERSDEVVARVVNDHTGEVVREIPREEVRDLARRLQEASGGALLDKHG